MMCPPATTNASSGPVPGRRRFIHMVVMTMATDGHPMFRHDGHRLDPGALAPAAGAAAYPWLQTPRAGCPAQLIPPAATVVSLWQHDQRARPGGEA